MDIYNESQEISQKCILCNGTNFYKTAGFYFCSDCQTQNDNIREAVLDVRYDLTTKVKNVKIKRQKMQITDVVGWTSWELYNFALIGIINELLEIGASPEIKWTTCQLWTWYLSKLEVAFTSTKKKEVPKMSKRFHKKDAEIIYGRVAEQKKKKKQSSRQSASSVTSKFTSKVSSASQLSRSKKRMAEAEYDKYLQSQASSRDDALSSMDMSIHSIQSSASLRSTFGRIKFNKSAIQEKKKLKEMCKSRTLIEKKCYQRNFVRTNFTGSPEILTPIKLWALAYLTLRIHNENIFLSDMLRFAREGHLSYYNMDHLIPVDVSITKQDINLLTQGIDIGHKTLRTLTARVARFVGVVQLPKPDLLVLIKRYCDELALPRGIALYAERIMLTAPPKMNFHVRSKYVPNYEGRAMAYIIFVLKVLFGLDGVTEKEISHVIGKINRIASDRNILESKLFNFCEWQEYIECRRSILINTHFPTKVKFDPEAPGNSDLYMRFIGMQRAKRDGKQIEEIVSKINMPKNITDALLNCIGGLEQQTTLREVEVFMPSFTPQRDYIAQLLNNSKYVLPNIIRSNFYDTKVGYMTMPESLKILAAQCGIKLDVVDGSLHFFEKIVPPYSPTPVPTFTKLCENVKIKFPKSKNTKLPVIKSKGLLDYVHRKRPCIMKVDFESLDNFNNVKSNVEHSSQDTELCSDEFAFDQVLPDGRLKIPVDSDSEDEEIPSGQFKKMTLEPNSTTCLKDTDFCKNYDIKLLDHEILSLENEEYSDESQEVKNLPEKSNTSEKTKMKRKKRRKLNSSESAGGSNSSVESEILDSTSDVVFSLPDSDISILEDKKNQKDKNKSINFENLILDDSAILFRPFKNYWLHHSSISQTNHKTFGLFERELPSTFRWLLDECANIVEMAYDELYEEVCLVESFHMHVVNPESQKEKVHKLFYRNFTSYYRNICSYW